MRLKNKSELAVFFRTVAEPEGEVNLRLQIAWEEIDKQMMAAAAMRLHVKAVVARSDAPSVFQLAAEVLQAPMLELVSLAKKKGQGFAQSTDDLTLTKKKSEEFADALAPCASHKPVMERPKQNMKDIDVDGFLIAVESYNFSRRARF